MKNVPDDMMQPIPAFTTCGVIVQLEQKHIAERVDLFNKIYGDAMIATSWDRLNGYRGGVDMVCREMHRIATMVRMLKDPDDPLPALDEITNLTLEMSRRAQIVRQLRNVQDPGA